MSDSIRCPWCAEKDVEIAQLRLSANHYREAVRETGDKLQAAYENRLQPAKSDNKTGSSLKNLADRLRVIAEYQLHSEGFYTQAEELEAAADALERLAAERDHAIESAGEYWAEWHKALSDRDDDVNEQELWMADMVGDPVGTLHHVEAFLKDVPGNSVVEKAMNAAASEREIERLNADIEKEVHSRVEHWRSSVEALTAERDRLKSALSRLTTACATNAKVMEFIDLHAFEAAVQVEEDYELLHGIARAALGGKE